MKKIIKIALTGAAIMLIGIWGGSYLFTVVSSAYEIAAFATTAMVTIAGALTVGYAAEKVREK